MKKPKEVKQGQMVTYKEANSAVGFPAVVVAVKENGTADLVIFGLAGAPATSRSAAQGNDDTLAEHYEV